MGTEHQGGGEWWSAEPRDEQRQEESEALAGAAADIRDAAEYLRDAATPPAPPEEARWDFTWFTNWVKDTPNGIAFKWAALTAGPLWTFFLASQEFELQMAAGMTAIGFAIIGGWHLRVERKATRLLTWGLPIGLAYYAPVAVVFGLAGILVGG